MRSQVVSAAHSLSPSFVSTQLAAAAVVAAGRSCAAAPPLLTVPRPELAGRMLPLDVGCTQAGCCKAAGGGAAATGAAVLSAAPSSGCCRCSQGTSKSSTSQNLQPVSNGPTKQPRPPVRSTKQGGRGSSPWMPRARCKSGGGGR